MNPPAPNIKDRRPGHPRPGTRAWNPGTRVGTPTSIKVCTHAHSTRPCTRQHIQVHICEHVCTLHTLVRMPTPMHTHGAQDTRIVHTGARVPTCVYTIPRNRPGSSAPSTDPEGRRLSAAVSGRLVRESVHPATMTGTQTEQVKGGSDPASRCRAAPLDSLRAPIRPAEPLAHGNPGCLPGFQYHEFIRGGGFLTKGFLYPEKNILLWKICRGAPVILFVQGSLLSDEAGASF